MYKDGSGEYFSYHDFHDYLERRKKVERNPGTEWFRIGGPESQMMFFEFASKKYPKMDVGSSYVLREKQEKHTGADPLCYVNRYDRPKLYIQKVKLSTNKWKQ